MLSLEEIRGLSAMNPELEKMFRDKAQGTETKPLLNVADIHMARNFFKLFYSIKRGSRPSASRLSCTTKDIRIPVRDGTLIPARVYTPRMLSPAPGCPCMYVCHAGGYVFGELDGQEELCELFSSMGGVAIDVLYRHAPEHPFPTAISDSYDGLDWVVQNHVNLGLNLAKGFILAGESNGSDIALAVARLYADGQPLSPPLTGLYLACPMVMNKDTVPEKYRECFVSMDQNADAPVLTSESIQFLQSLYKPDLSSPLALPILFPDHSRWPRTYFQICGMDPLRDGGLIFAQILEDCGVEVKTDIFPGLPHCFWGAFMHAAFTKKHTIDLAAGLRWLLAA